MNNRPNFYPNIRNIPREAWKKKAWPITEQEVLKPELEGQKAIDFEKKRSLAKERLPYKDDSEVPF